MNFSEYQKQSRTTAKYPRLGGNFTYPTLGLVGEAGEVADKIKKLIRDQNIETPAAVKADDRTEIKKELGDVLWYVAQIATEFELDLEDVAQTNLTKLLSRLDRGQITGSGDNR
jgi:NTP pyrophosphatase (non-canonical NTP hydrolase)